MPISPLQQTNHLLALAIDDVYMPMGELSPLFA